MKGGGSRVTSPTASASADERFYYRSGQVKTGQGTEHGGTYKWTVMLARSWRAGTRAFAHRTERRQVQVDFHGRYTQKSRVRFRARRLDVERFSACSIHKTSESHSVDPSGRLAYEDTRTGCRPGPFSNPSAITRSAHSRGRRGEAALVSGEPDNLTSGSGLRVRIPPQPLQGGLVGIALKGVESHTGGSGDGRGRRPDRQRGPRGPGESAGGTCRSRSVRKCIPPGVLYHMRVTGFKSA